MADRKRVTFNYDSDPGHNHVDGRITMNFYNNDIITNDGKLISIGPNIDVLGYAPDGIPFVAAKECLEEMLALVNAAMAAK